MNLEDIMLNKISQKNKHCMISLKYEIKKNVKAAYNGGYRRLGRGRGNGELFHQRVQSFSFVEWVSSEDLTNSIETIFNNSVLYSWNLLKVDFNCSLQKKATMWWIGILISLIVIIIWWCVHVIKTLCCIP